MSTSEVGGRLSQLEYTIQELIRILGLQGLQQNFIGGTPAKNASDVGMLTSNVVEDMLGDNNIVKNLAEDVPVSVDHVGDALEDTLEDMEDDVDYLVESISDAADKESEQVVVDDVERDAAQDVSIAAVLSAMNEVLSSANMLSEVMSDPYSIGVKVIAGSAVVPSQPPIVKELQPS